LFAYGMAMGANPAAPSNDTVKLKTSGAQAFYQDTIKADSISERLIYLRAIQFMAGKNFQQNYGYQEEGKAIFTTAQDLNVNPTSVNDENETVEQYTVQFSISLDIKTHSYRYTISNVLFFRPTDTGNRRETLYDIYGKETNTSSKRVSKYANKFLASFEKYLDTLLAELKAAIEQKSPVYSKY
jgi:hypothetical protein